MTTLILLWLVPLWLLGWLILPAARRLFVNLPDGGLATGRVLGLAVPTLIAFWFATARIVPLTLAPLWLGGLPLVAAYLNLQRPDQRREFVQWVRDHRRGLLASDLVFLAAFGFFLWIRMRWPEIDNLEKSMDSGLMASMAFTRYLPADSFWFAGQPFTDYYYFGHLMGGLLSRSFQTPMAYAFNLVQPTFCALFVAPLWSLCAGLTGSARRGAAAAFLVAMAGNFEPVLELYKLYQGSDATHFWLTSNSLYRPWYPWSPSWLVQHLNWWSTSRVIPDTMSGGNVTYTINEYPIFTLSIGDVHAHFFAFSLAAAFFCGCYALFAPGRPADSGLQLTRRRALLVVLGVLLGCMWMTSTWDLPTYGGLALLCALWTLSENRGAETAGKSGEFWWALLPFALAWLTAWPYSHRYQPQVKGAVFEPWSPGYYFLFLWIGFLALWVICLEARTKTKAYRYGSPIVPIALLVVNRYKIATGRDFVDLAFVLGMLCLTFLSALSINAGDEKSAENDLAEEVAGRSRSGTGEMKFETLLALCGFVALAAPMVFYIKGYFGQGYLHQDTVFKFTLQAWLLLGTASCCGAVSVLCRGFRQRPWVRWPMGILWAVCWIPALLCAACVIYTRTVSGAPRTPSGDSDFSLDGAAHVPRSDRAGMQWLQTHAAAGDRILEAVGQDGYGHLAGEYDPAVGRVAAFTGVPDALGWPQHAMEWGADFGTEVAPRWETVRDIYLYKDPGTAFAELHNLGIRYVFIGDTERHNYPPDALEKLEAALHEVFRDGGTFIGEVPTH